VKGPANVPSLALPSPWKRGTIRRYYPLDLEQRECIKDKRLALNAKAGYDFRMDLLKMIAELREERARIDEATLILERLARGHRRRGRPPAWMKAAEFASGQPPARKRRLKEKTVAQH